MDKRIDNIDSVYREINLISTTGSNWSVPLFGVDSEVVFRYVLDNIRNMYHKQAILIYHSSDGRFLTVVFYQDDRRGIKLNYSNLKSKDLTLCNPDTNTEDNLLLTCSNQLSSTMSISKEVESFLASADNKKYYKTKRVHFKPFAIETITNIDHWREICTYNNINKGFLLDSDDMYYCLACSVSIKCWYYHHKKSSTHITKCSTQQKTLSISQYLIIQGGNIRKNDDNDGQNVFKDDDDQSDSHSESSDDESSSGDESIQTIEQPPTNITKRVLDQQDQQTPIKLIKFTNRISNEPNRPQQQQEAPLPKQQPLPHRFQSIFSSEYQEYLNKLTDTIGNMEKYKQEICRVVDPIEELIKEGKAQEAIDWIKQVRESLLPNEADTTRLFNLLKNNKNIE